MLISAPHASKESCLVLEKDFQVCSLLNLKSPDVFKLFRVF